jgi:hypothetical protein
LNNPDMREKDTKKLRESMKSIEAKANLQRRIDMTKFKAMLCVEKRLRNFKDKIRNSLSSHNTITQMARSNQSIQFYKTPKKSTQSNSNLIFIIQGRFEQSIDVTPEGVHTPLKSYIAQEKELTKNVLSLTESLETKKQLTRKLRLKLNHLNRQVLKASQNSLLHSSNLTKGNFRYSNHKK